MNTVEPPNGSYPRCQVATHDAGSLFDKDFELAAAIEPVTAR